MSKKGGDAEMEKLITAAELAKQTGYTRQHIYNLAALGRIPVQMIGKRIFFAEKEV